MEVCFHWLNYTCTIAMLVAQNVMWHSIRTCFSHQFLFIEKLNSYFKVEYNLRLTRDYPSRQYLNALFGHMQDVELRWRCVAGGATAWFGCSVDSA
jgi:hypothetical protein